MAKVAAAAVARAEKLKMKVGAANKEFKVRQRAVLTQTTIVKAAAKRLAMRNKSSITVIEKGSCAKVKAERDEERRRIAAIKLESSRLTVDAKMAKKEVKKVKSDALKISNSFRHSFIQECKKANLGTKNCKTSYMSTLKVECKKDRKITKDCKLLKH